MNTIQSAWEEFFKIIVLPVGPSPIQTEEMKKAFYSGSASILSTITKIAEQDIPNEVGVSIFQKLLNESDEFFLQLLKKPQ